MLRSSCCRYYDKCDDCCLPDSLFHLSDSQSKELQSVLSKFKDTFSPVPGMTNICLFRMKVHFNMPPYRVPNGI